MQFFQYIIFCGAFAALPLATFAAPKAAAPGAIAHTPVARDSSTSHTLLALTSKPQNLPRILLPTMPEADLAKQPITEWFKLQAEFQRQYALLEAHRADQSRLLDQLEVLRRGRDSKKGALLPQSSGKIQNLIRQLHGTQQNCDEILKSLDTAGARIVPLLPAIHTQLLQIQDKWLQQLKTLNASGHAETPSKSYASNMAALIEENLNLVADISTATDSADDKILRYLERKAAAAPDASSQNVAVRLLKERIEKIQREQWLLEQRIEENRSSLEEIQHQLDFLVKKQNSKSLSPGGDEETAPQPPAPLPEE